MSAPSSPVQSNQLWSCHESIGVQQSLSGTVPCHDVYAYDSSHVMIGVYSVLANLFLTTSFQHYQFSTLLSSRDRLIT